MSRILRLSISTAIYLDFVPGIIILVLIQHGL